MIADPFGGVGLGGVIAAYRGLRWLGVELEPRFVALAEENFALHAGRWENGGLPRPTILQGDSRRFAEIVGQCAGIVTSPPYADTDIAAKRTGTSYGSDFSRTGKSPRALGEMQNERYAATPGQIGQLKAGDLDAILTSPPYAASVPEKSSTGINIDKQWETYRAQGGGMSLEKFRAQQERHSHGYGQTPGNIGNLPDKGLDGIVTSPPWEDYHSNILPRAEDGHDGGAVATFNRTGKWPERRAVGMNYGKADGQIGNDSGGTYWQAVAEVYRQCLLALKPGGVLACVVKGYVKAGKLVPLPDQTHDLLLHIGFEPLERVRALLVKETTTAGLFGEKTTRKERKSFFRRLAEKKGSPPIDWEDVLFLRRPQ